MASEQLYTFIRRLRRLVGPAAAEGPSDAQLLQRFVQTRDEEAFELLVWRHGAMVLNVCRRVLRREHDAEDAFQATFLTLVRKAGAIGKREAVSSWLYKVAYRVALRARNAAPPRSLPEEPLRDPAAPEPISILLGREIGSAIDEEVHRLPARYRVAFVLCHLEGQTIASAARTLDCPPGTIGTWLARARGLLRRRLARRGFDLSTVLESRHIVAALSAALVNSTVRAALLGSAEQAAAAGLISAATAALTKGALRTMSLTQWTATTAIVLTLSLFGGGTALLAHRVLAVEPARGATVPDHRRSSAGKTSTVPVLFRWKFHKDQPFYQVFTTRTTQVMNNDVTQAQEQTFYLQWTPEKKLGGRWIIAQKILDMKMDIDIGGNPVEYDLTRALVGAEFTLLLDANTREIVRIEGHKEFVNKLAADNKTMKPLLDKILSADALKEMAETCFASQLMGPARPGDSWTKRRQRDQGPIGIWQIASRYTYVGKDGQLDTIKVESTPHYLPPLKREGIGGMPFQIEKAAMSGKGMGILLFDRARGRIARMKSSEKLQGEMTILIGGQETQVELSQTQQTIVQTMDVNPLLVRPGGGENKELQRLRKENERLRRRLQAVEEALHHEDKPK